MNDSTPRDDARTPRPGGGFLGQALRLTRFTPAPRHPTRTGSDPATEPSTRRRSR